MCENVQRVDICNAFEREREREKTDGDAKKVGKEIEGDRMRQKETEGDRRKQKETEGDGRRQKETRRRQKI